MKGFNFEKNLQHQSQAVKSTVSVFDNLEIEKPKGVDKQFLNPIVQMYDGNTTYAKNIIKAQEANSIKSEVNLNLHSKSNIIDIMMETGTGKTYTYTKTIFELNKNYGLFKFIVIVPTLSIKAGTVDFLKSDSARAHFKEQYGKTIKLHSV